MEAAATDIAAEKMHGSSVFEMVATAVHRKWACFTCPSMVSAYTELKMDHRSALVHRKLKWLVNDPRFTYPFLRHPVIEALGLNTRVFPAVAADRFSGSIDIDRLIGAYVEKKR